jgi:hypothetical protein
VDEEAPPCSFFRLPSLAAFCASGLLVFSSSQVLKAVVSSSQGCCLRHLSFVFSPFLVPLRVYIKKKYMVCRRGELEQTTNKATKTNRANIDNRLPSRQETQRLQKLGSRQKRADAPPHIHARTHVHAHPRTHIHDGLSKEK